MIGHEIKPHSVEFYIQVGQGHRTYIVDQFEGKNVIWSGTGVNCSLKDMVLWLIKERGARIEQIVIIEGGTFFVLEGYVKRREALKKIEKNNGGN